jgi:hypothetical protein
LCFALTFGITTALGIRLACDPTLEVTIVDDTLTFVTLGPHT